MTQTPDVERALLQEQARTKPRPRLPVVAALTRDFNAFGEDRYVMEVPEVGIRFEADRIRREHDELNAELSVFCDLPGARTVNGSNVISIVDLNFSSARARSDRVKLLKERSNAAELDWGTLLEEFCQRVLQADRHGQPAVDLRQIERPSQQEAVIDVEGFVLPRQHPSILYGDGGSGKTYFVLWLGGRMVEQGLTVALFDWELSPGDHRIRLEKLFPDGMPRIVYVRCERPLPFEADRLRRIVREGEVDFAIYDSCAFACDGPPESAEIAARYFRAVRQIGCGSVHIAHISKAEGGDKKPFGSTFWHNGARSTWYLKADEESLDGDVLRVGLYNRKANLGRLRPPLGFSIAFTEERTMIRRINLAESPGLASQLTVRQRMMALLRRGAMSPEAIAEEIDAEAETVKRTARRYKDTFTVIDGGRLGLLERSAS